LKGGWRYGNVCGRDVGTEGRCRELAGSSGGMLGEMERVSGG